MRKKERTNFAKGTINIPLSQSLSLFCKQKIGENFPLSPFVCFRQFSVAFVSIKKKSPTEWPRIYFSIRLNYLRSLALMRTTFPLRTTTNSPSSFFVFSIRRFRASKIPALIFSCICFISISLIVCNCFVG